MCITLHPELYCDGATCARGHLTYIKISDLFSAISGMQCHFRLCVKVCDRGRFSGLGKWCVTQHVLLCVFCLFLCLLACCCQCQCPCSSQLTCKAMDCRPQYDQGNHSHQPCLPLWNALLTPCGDACPLSDFQCLLWSLLGCLVAWLFILSTLRDLASCIF